MKMGFDPYGKNPLKKITTSGASHLDYADINSNSLVLETSGASHCDLAGKINSLQIETSGASHINAKYLIANNVSLKASGATHVVVYAKKLLEVHASGVANIDYYGNPKKVIKDASGMASMESR